MATPGMVHSFVAKAATSVVYVNMGDVFNYVAANYGSGLEVHFEAFLRATTGTAFAQLYNTTTSAEVSGSTVNTTSATLVRKRSGTLTLADGNEYRARFGTSAADAGAAVGAKLVIV